MTSNFQLELSNSFRSIPDFPKPGIIFKDISPILADANLWKETINDIANAFRNKNITKIVGIDARGFLVGISLAMELGIGFVMARKPSKLPGEKLSVSYGLEYGKDCLEISKDSIQPDDRVLIVDDLLATGGTAEAAGKLVSLGNGIIVGYAFIVELKSLKGRERLMKSGKEMVYSCCYF